jgi:hypothetical protein
MSTAQMLIVDPAGRFEPVTCQTSHMRDVHGCGHMTWTVMRAHPVQRRNESRICPGRLERARDEVIPASESDAIRVFVLEAHT